MFYNLINAKINAIGDIFNQINKIFVINVLINVKAVKILKSFVLVVTQCKALNICKKMNKKTFQYVK